MKKSVHLAVAFDSSYLNPFYALASSVFFNNPELTISFHCIAPDLSVSERAEMQLWIKENNADILFYDIDPTSLSDLVTRNHWSTAVYYKIFFPSRIDKSIERILYLDCDTLVLSSLRELYEMDLGGFPVAAVRDPHAQLEPYNDLHVYPDYFNSGVMLIDVNRWKALEISQKTFRVLRERPDQIVYVDQDALNKVLQGLCRIIPERYNFTFTHFASDASLRAAKEKTADVVILHFTLTRPWHFLCRNRLRGLYRFYLNRSPRKREKTIVDFSWVKIPAYLKIRATEVYLDTEVLKKMVKAIRRIKSIIRIANARELCKIFYDHFLFRRLSDSDPLLHRVLVFAIACADHRILISRKPNQLLLLEWSENNKPAYFFVRKYSRDLLVFAEFFIQRWPRNHYAFNGRHPNEIIDAGANIGCAALYLRFQFPHAKIVCIEPEESNLRLLMRNIEVNNAVRAIEPLQRAIWNSITELQLMQRDWSHDGFHVMQKPQPDSVISNVKTTTIPEVMNQQGFHNLDFLKIDIEGAEEKLFTDHRHLETFLPLTRKVIVEVHNEFIADEQVQRELEAFSFVCQKFSLKGQPTVIVGDRT
jgi:FkbM family methyltransferase